MLDRIPAWLRHLLIVVAATFGVTVAEAVVSAGGVSTVDWLGTLLRAVDIAAVAGATTSLALWLTPLTRQYGVGADGSTPKIK